METLCNQDFVEVAKSLLTVTFEAMLDMGPLVVQRHELHYLETNPRWSVHIRDGDVGRAGRRRWRCFDTRSNNSWLSTFFWQMIGPVKLTSKKLVTCICKTHAKVNARGRLYQRNDGTTITVNRSQDTSSFKRYARDFGLSKHGLSSSWRTVATNSAAHTTRNHIHWYPPIACTIFGCNGFSPVYFQNKQFCNGSERISLLLFKKACGFWIIQTIFVGSPAATQRRTIEFRNKKELVNESSCCLFNAHSSSAECEYLSAVIEFVHGLNNSGNGPRFVQPVWVSVSLGRW